MINRDTDTKHKKKIILIDLNGVLNIYTGKYNENKILPMKEDAYDFLKKLAMDFRIYIFTAGDNDLAHQWIIENNLSEFIEGVTNSKNRFVSVILDDRAINFDGDFEKAYQAIKNFKPYWKQY